MSADHTTPELQELDRLIILGETDPDDPHWQGKVLLFMARRVRYMMERDTVSEKSCAKRMDDLEASLRPVEKRDISEGSPAVYLLRETIRWVPAPVLLFIFMIGKGAGWW